VAAVVYGDPQSLRRTSEGGTASGFAAPATFVDNDKS